MLNLLTTLPIRKRGVMTVTRLSKHPPGTVSEVLTFLDMSNVHGASSECVFLQVSVCANAEAGKNRMEEDEEHGNETIRIQDKTDQQRITQRKN